MRTFFRNFIIMKNYIDFFFYLFLLPNLHSHLYDICFVNVLDSFIPVIILRTCKFKSSVSFRTHTLLDRASRVLQLPTHLSRLTAIG